MLAVSRGDRLAVGWRDVTTATASAGIGRDKRSLTSLLTVVEVSNRGASSESGRGPRSGISSGTE